MHSRRVLHVRVAPWSGLAPILAALMSLVALALLAFVVAFWPQQQRHPAFPPASGESAPAQRSYEGGLTVPAKRIENAGRTRSI